MLSALVVEEAALRDTTADKQETQDRRRDEDVTVVVSSLERVKKRMAAWTLSSALSCSSLLHSCVRFPWLDLSLDDAATGEREIITRSVQSRPKRKRGGGG